MSRRVPLFCLVVMSMAIELNGQENGEVVNSRVEQIEAERIEKAATLVPDRPRRTERLFNKYHGRNFQGSGPRADTTSRRRFADGVRP